LDFETSATGFSVIGCTFSHSYGAGIMVFGHDTTSHNLLIADNLFQETGCTQPRDDRGGISFVCPNNQKPSATVANNKFWTCVNSEAMHDRIPGCSDDVTKTNNTINQGDYVLEPTLNLDPVAPTDNDPTPTMMLLASSLTANATLRYTTDGSRPSPDSPVMPAAGIPVLYPGPDMAVNVRGFMDGMAPSVTNTMVVERSMYRPRSAILKGVRSNVDAVTLNTTSGAVAGWALDTSLPGGGVPPVTVQITVDLKVVAQVTADGYRPDLVTAGIAPNAYHGFSVALPSEAVAALQKGAHLLDAFVVESPSSTPIPQRFDSIHCIADGKVGGC